METAEGKPVTKRARERVPNPPPYADAAELVTERLWCCRVCGRAWAADLELGDRFDPEGAARACHTGIRRCSMKGCPELTEPHKTWCAPHLAGERRIAWLKQPVGKWDGSAPVFSHGLDKWFTSPGDAFDYACGRLMGRLDEEDEEDEGPRAVPVALDAVADERVLAELEDMRIVLGKPVTARVFELSDWLHDELPDQDEGDEPDLASCGPAVEALNKALEDLGALSWTPSRVRLDLAACLAGEEEGS